MRLNDLLSKELWCHSSTHGNWWKYSRFTGYVIGLGDRHLVIQKPIFDTFCICFLKDNILVNLTNGELAR